MSESEDDFDYVAWAETYEEKNAKATIPLAKRMVELASSNRPIASDSVVHDNACGPGIVAEVVLTHFAQESTTSDSASPPQIHCTDSSPEMLAVATRKFSSKPKVKIANMSCMALTFPDSTFTHNFTSLAIFLFSPTEAITVASEIYRTLVPGGVAALSSVKQVGWLPPFQRAQARVRAQDKDTPWRGMQAPEWSTKEHLMGVLEGGGFNKEKMHVDTMATPISMEGFLTRQAPMILTATTILTKHWSDEEREEFKKALVEEVEIEEKNDSAAMQFWIVVAQK